MSLILLGFKSSSGNSFVFLYQLYRSFSSPEEAVWVIPAGFSQRFQTLPRIFSPCRASSPAPRRQGGSCRWLTSVLNVRGVSPSPSRFRLPSLTLVWGSARSRRFWRRFCAARTALCHGCHRSCCFMLCTDRSAWAVSSASLHEVAVCLQGQCPGQTGCQETGLRFLMTKGIHRALKILSYKILVLIYPLLQDSSRWVSCFQQESTCKRTGTATLLSLFPLSQRTFSSPYTCPGHWDSCYCDCLILMIINN